ncbi:MAG TPA: FkbM family methyltransferase [Verrucomicrobiae bacterium]|nr:FkbM family methyltransferase [Verrucomicrobiae bacterium]
MSLKSALLSLVTQPGYELRKYRVQRWWQRRGIHLEMAKHAKFSYDACNFCDVPPGDDAVIFDVGANIGQSSVWFSEVFPQATIHAFEPFSIIYKRLEETVAGRSHVHLHQFAIGKANSELQVAPVQDAYYQCGQIVAATQPQGPTETIRIRSLDSFCEEQKISHIHVLKSDTEGFDIDVLRGAERMLRAGCIHNFLTEASIAKGDEQHTSLFALIDYLRPYSLELHGIYDMHHGRENGKLEYFNALFQLKK